MITDFHTGIFRDNLAIWRSSKRASCMDFSSFDDYWLLFTTGVDIKDEFGHLGRADISTELVPRHNPTEFREQTGGDDELKALLEQEIEKLGRGSLRRDQRRDKHTWINNSTGHLRRAPLAERIEFLVGE